MTRKKVISISLGANVCSKDGAFNLDAIRSISSQLKRLVSLDYNIAAVVGLGGAAREAINTASRYTKNSRELDEIKILVTRINASLLIASLRVDGVRVIPYPLSSVEEVHKISSSVGVFGGIKPGLNSDASAASISKRIACPLIIVSTMGAIYEKDPALEESKRLASIERDYLRDLLKSGNQGSHVLDLQTCKLLLGMPRRSSVMVTGYKSILAAAEGKDKSGTRILL